MQVARLAGVPGETLKQAQRYFARLDKFNTRDDAQQDLFAGGTSLDEGKPLSRTEAIVAKLATLDPDTLSPRDALAALYELKRSLDN